MKIAIIGSGITGLTTALALHKLGYEPTVYERAPELNEIGAGLWIQPNGIFVLNWLGLKEEIQSEGMLMQSMEITHKNMKAVASVDPNSTADKHGNKTVAIHRARLQKLLFKTCNVRLVNAVKLGYEFEGFTGSSISFLNGQSVEADLVIGADGINSKVRQAIFTNSSLRNTHQNCWRGIANFSLPQSLITKGREMWGNKHRFGFAPISKNEVYWFAVANEELAPLEIDQAQLVKLFANFNPLVGDLISATPSIYKAVLHDLKPMPKWSKNNTILLGDAGHATTPNMGQGACQGIEDAYSFANHLNKHKGLKPCFEEFEKHRRQKVDYVVNTSWQIGKMAHNPITQLMLKSMMKITPQWVLKKQMRSLYSVAEL